MYRMVTIVNITISCLKIVKWVALKRSHHKKKGAVALRGNRCHDDILWSLHKITNIKLCCIPGTNIMLIISQLKKKT